MFLDIWQTVAIIYLGILYFGHRKYEHKDNE